MSVADIKTDPLPSITIKDLMRDSHSIAVSKGWWEGGDRNIAEMLALIHSEISEALEEWRLGHPLNEMIVVNGKPEGFVVELADAVIRIADLCERYGLDLEEALRIKQKYNATRPHRHGGKIA